jgi:hypothetical protein
MGNHLVSPLVTSFSNTVRRKTDFMLKFILSILQKTGYKNGKFVITSVDSYYSEKYKKMIDLYKRVEDVTFSLLKNIDYKLEGQYGNLQN